MCGSGRARRPGLRSAPGASLSRVARTWIIGLLQGNAGLLERVVGTRLDDYTSDAA